MMVEVMKSCDVNVFGRGIIENVCDFAMTHATLVSQKTRHKRLTDEAAGRRVLDCIGDGAVQEEIVAGGARAAFTLDDAARRRGYRDAAPQNKGTHAQAMVESRPPSCRGDEIGKHSGLKRLSARPETIGAEPFKFGETPDARIEATPSQASRHPRGRCRD
ncbi:hypothetical protein [Burkholderia contaminans]|uniref:hypothetical protein n=1 Tax=Burkholderia contaminans TaxID=488447 RepID=UPI00158C8385|nr:hypothetical protein [Burkholderia contaminans]